MTSLSEPIRDWRGIIIEPGLTVVYGGPVGRSIQMVEGEVVGFTKSGRVNVKVIRRAYTSGDRDVVHVGADRLTVVDALPPTTNATQAEESAVRAERRRRYQTHDIPSYWLNQHPWTNPDRNCRRCSITHSDAYETECISEL